MESRIHEIYHKNDYYHMEPLIAIWKICFAYYGTLSC